MAVGTGIGFDLSFLDRLDEADKKLDQFIKTSQGMSATVIKSWQDIAVNGVDPFLQKMKEQKTALESIANMDLSGAGAGMKKLASEATSAVTSVNQVIDGLVELSRRTATYDANAGLHDLKIIDDQIKARKHADEEDEKNKAAAHAQREKELNDFFNKEIAADEKAYERWLELKEKERIANEAAETEKHNRSIQNIGRQSAAYQKAEDERYQQWLKDKDEEARKEQALADAKWQRQKNTIYQQNAQMAAEEHARIQREAQQTNERAKNNSAAYQTELRERERFYLDWINRTFEADERKRKKEEDEEKKKNERIAKEQERLRAKYDSASRRERYKSYTTSYEGAIRTSDKAKTLAQEIQAVKNLEAARAKLNTTTADGKKKLDDINKRILQHNKNIQHATEGAKELEKAHSKLGSKIATVFSVQAIRGYINKMIQVRGEMELQQRSLQAILQNKDEANEIWQKTIDLAIKSPFRIKDLVTYTKQLAAYRVESDKLYETNKMLADVSAGLGVDMNRLILAFGQVKAANFLRGTELRQFTEAGIPMLDELAKHFNDMNNTALTSADVFDMISKRMVLFEDVEAVFERMTRAGGTFYRMQEIQSETLRGQISNLKDSLDIMLNNMGKDMDGILKGSVKSVKFLVDNYQTLVPILKALIASFALYKIQAFEASKVTLRFARAMKLQKISASGLGGMWTSLRVGLAQFYKGMVKTASMMASNPWLVGIAAFAALALEIRKVVKQFNEVDKAYNDMLNQQAEITSKFFKASDMDERKKALKELIDYANKEYEFGLSVDLKPMSDDEVKAYMNDLRQRMIDANAFGAEFQKELIEANLKTKWNFADWLTVGVGEQGMLKDIDQMGNSYDNLNRIMVNNLAPTIDLLSTKLADLSDNQLTALKSLKAGIGEWEDEDEDMVAYFDRIQGNYKTLIHLLDDSDNIADKKIARQIKKYQRRHDEARKEFQTFIDGIDKTVSNLNKEDKTVFLNAAIDDAKAEKNWSEFEETKIRKWLEEVYEIELTPKIVEGSDSLKAWQDSYNDLFRGKTGFREIRSIGTSQKQVIEQLNAQYESTAELLERIQLAGEESVLEGGAYEGEDLARLKNDLADIREQLDWFGAQAKKDDKKESASIKILQKRINLLKEVNKKYLELEKTFDAVTAKEKVMEAYSDTFREAFEGTGVDLDMYKVMTQVITDSKKVGEEMGESLSDGMLEKLKGLEEAGTYIRKASKDIFEQLKKDEGFKNLAYPDIGGGWSIGIASQMWPDGRPVKEGDYWTDEQIWEYSQDIIAEHEKRLNAVLDLHKDIVVTQEQYNALLNQTWQSGTASPVFTYAKDAEKFYDWLKKIDGIPIVRVFQRKRADGTTYNERVKTGKTFDIDVDAIMKQYNELETIHEKMALVMQYTSVRTKAYGDTTQFMIDRALRRSQQFRGDLDIAKQLETVLVRIAGMDFTTTEGMVESLGKLKEIAEKEGPEAKNILSQAISGLEAEIGVRLKKESDKKLNDEVQAMFDRYELTVDLKKLNLPRQAAEALFDVKYLDLDGLRKAVQDKASEFVGTDQYEKYQDYLDKIDEMERKSIVERTKTYAEYLTRGMNDRVKLKVEELRKLKELEESKEFNPDQKEQIRGQIKADTQNALDKESWEQFQATEWYTLMFTDLETLGTQAINNLHDELSQLKDSLSHLDPSEVKEIVNQMDKLQEQLIKRNPFEAFVTARQNIKALAQSEEDVMSQLKAHEDNQAYAQKMLDMLAEIEVARAEYTLGDLQGETLALFQSLRAEVFAGNKNAFKDAREEYEGLLAKAKEGADLTSEQIQMFAQYRQSLQSISNYWGEVNDKIQDIVGSAVDIMEVYGLSESSKVIAESVGSMSTLITQAVQFGIQMKAAGLAANTALGVIGWIAIAIQAIATVLTAIANYKNAKIDEQLEKQAKTIERQRDLYEQIEKKVESAYSVDQLRQYNNELERSVELEIQALEASIAMERSRKNADEDQIADWQKEIAEARERLAESKQEMMEELGGMFDITDFASGFVDAWWNAMDEGKSGLDALGEHFEETMKDMVKKQALYQGAQNIMKQVQDIINQDLANDYDIDDWQKIWDVAKKANVDLDAFLQGWYDMFGSLSDGANGGLSALQKGIQGVSEETAQVIEAYLNSIRGYVSEQVTHTRNIYRILYDAVHSDAAAIRVRMV